MSDFEIKVQCRGWEEIYIRMNNIPRIGESIQLKECSPSYMFDIINVIYSNIDEHREYTSYGITLECEERRIDE